MHALLPTLRACTTLLHCVVCGCFTVVCLCVVRCRYLQVRDRVHLAIFDDSYHERFPTFLDKNNETAWHTNLDSAYASTRGPVQDAAVLSPLEQMLRKAASGLLERRPDLRAPAGAAARKALIDGEGRLVLPPGAPRPQDSIHRLSRTRDAVLL